jgi:hypothetical protein
MEPSIGSHVGGHYLRSIATCPDCPISLHDFSIVSNLQYLGTPSELSNLTPSRAAAQAAKDLARIG